MAKKVTTPMFRVSFPAVFEARQNTLSGKVEYSVVMLFDKDMLKTSKEWAAMKAAAAEVAKEKWGDKVQSLKLRSPFRDGDVDKSERVEFKNCMFITCRSKNRPGVVDEAVQPMLDPTQFYAGCYARATINMFAYDQAGNRGVSCGLINLQKMRDGEPLTSRIAAEDDFAPIAPPESLAEDAPAENTNIGDLF